MKIAIDLDGTLAYHQKWEGPTIIGDPVPKMLDFVKRLLKEGHEVVIFTARITRGTPYDNTGAYEAVRRYIIQHVGQELEITNIKSDFDLFFDDRAVQVIRNEGVAVIPTYSRFKPIFIKVLLFLAGFGVAFLVRSC